MLRLDKDLPKRIAVPDNFKGGSMKKEDASTLKALWEMRNLSVKECINKISNNSDLKFLLSAVGIWFFVRLLLTIWIVSHVIYFVGRIFNMVLS